MSSDGVFLGTVKVSNLSSISSAVNISDSSGDPILSNNNCIQSALFDGVGNALTSTSSALDVNIKTTTVGLALDTSVQDLVTLNTQRGGTFWPIGSTVADSTDSAVVRMNQKNGVVYSYFGNVTCNIGDSPIVTVSYSADGTNFYKTSTVFTLPAGGGDFAGDQPSGAAYVKLTLTGCTTASATPVAAFLNTA